MSNVAIIEYYTSGSGTHAFLIKAGYTRPLVFEVRGEAGPLLLDDLQLRAERLLVDIQGLPAGWDERPAMGRYRKMLSLPPAIHAQKRSKEIRQINLYKPAFGYDWTYLEQLSDLLLPAALRAEIEDCDLLCIIPHGPLHALPFAALRWSEHEYLIERFGLCHAHSISVLRYSRSKNRRRMPGLDGLPQSCLIAAVAAADDPDPEEFETDGDTLAELFTTLNEGGDVTSLVGAVAVAGSAPASKERIRERIAQSDLIHMACHGIFGSHGGRGDPLDSRLLVSDGREALTLEQAGNPTPEQLSSHFLTAREVFDLTLRADLVTLRACSSGRSHVSPGDELIGLTRAFLYAGTPSVIVSLWDVNKRSSRRLLDDFYTFWLNRDHGLPKWQALQRAQLNLIRDTQYRHPYHWAPFVLVGDWK